MDSDLLSVMADISNIEMPKTELIDVKPEVPPDLTQIETGSGHFTKQTGSGSEFSKNPWTVPTLEDFLFYCCPECPDKYRSSISFTNHALKNHPKSKEKFGELYLPELEFGPEDEQNDDINADDFNEDNEDGDEPDDENDVKPDLPDLDDIDNDESDESSNQESRLE